MGDLVQPSPGCRSPASELARVVNTAKTMPGTGWRKAIAVQVRKMEKGSKKMLPGRQRAGGVQPGERHEGMIWWRTKGEMEGPGEGMVIASKQAEAATAGGRGRK